MANKGPKKAPLTTSPHPSAGEAGKLGPSVEEREAPKKMLSSHKQLALVKKHLLERREQLQQGVREEYREVVGRSTMLTGDSTDIAQDLTEESVSFGILANEKEELAQVEAALKRISEGTYGICEACEKPIPLKRLKFLPYATKCIRCKSKEEQRAEGSYDSRFSFGAVEDATEEEEEEEENTLR